MIRKKVLGVGVSSATMLVEDTEASGKLCVLKRINVSLWDPEEVAETYNLYKSLTQAKIPSMVELQSVMLQDSFLNLVTPYYTGGDLESYLEDELRTSFDEAKAARWMLHIAKTVERAQELIGCCFYGLSADRIFFEDNEQGLRVGLPMPRQSYFKWLSERETLGVAVVREYPAEVVNTRRYDKKASDVWHLGLIGQKMLSARANYFNRSSEIRAIIDSMMESSVERRLGISGVVRKLTEFLSAGGPRRSLTSVASSRFATPHLGPMANPPPTEEHPADRGDGRSRHPRGHSARPSDAQGEQASPRRPRQRLPSNWHRHALEQFEELERLRGSPFCGKPRPRSPAPMTARRHRSVSPRMATSRSHSARGAITLPFSRSADAQAGLGTRNASVPVRTLAALAGKGNVTAAQYMRIQQMEEKRKRDALKQENETRRWKQVEMERAAQDAHRSHVDKMKVIRTKRGEETKSDIRKHIRQWKEQRPIKMDENVIVNDKGDISVFLPKNAPQVPSSAAALQTPLRTNGKENGFVASETEERGESANPTKSPQSSVCVLANARTPPSFVPKRVATSYQERGVSPHVPRTRPNPVVAAVSSAITSSGEGEMSSPSVGPSKRRHSDVVAGGGTPDARSKSRAAKSPQKSAAAQVNGDGPKPGPVVASGGSDGARLFASLDHSLKSLRESLSRLLKDRDLYHNTIRVVDAFVLRPEAERHHPQLNVLFINNLRRVLNDEGLLLAAVPLCAQLVALQNLLQASHAGTKQNAAMYHGASAEFVKDQTH